MKRARIGLAAAILLAGLLCAGCTPDAPRIEEPFDVSVRVAVNRAESAGKISPYIYGQFIEHIETCIYNGIWSEMILDRKFYYPVGEAGLSPWSSGAGAPVVSDAADTYANGYAAVLAPGAELVQKNISVERNRTYTGYVYAKARSAAALTVTLGDGNKINSARIALEGGGGWKKVSFELTGAADTSRASVGFRAEGGTVRLDALSLMPADNYLGMRRDTLEALKELNSPMYRWPGGNFLSGYDWKDGVGDRDKRPSRRNLHYMGLPESFASEEAMIASDIVKLNYLGFYGGIEPNDYGLDEFLAMCEYLGAEPLMMVNDGLGSVEDAEDQVEYCNGSESTEYGSLRARNGHGEPYGIVYWGVGNEMFGGWQLGQVPIAEYVSRHNAFAARMKSKDGGIKVIAVGNNASNWSDAMFAGSGDSFDFIAEHMYAKRDETDLFKHVANVRDNFEGRIAGHRALLKKYPQHADVKLAFTEYAYENVTCASRLKDGLGIGVYLNAMIRNADVFELACYSSTVNATQGCITTTDTAAVMQGAGYVMKLYRDWFGDTQVSAWVQYTEDTRLDVAAALLEDGTLTLAVVNPSDKAVKLDSPLIDGESILRRVTLAGDYPDSFNSPQKSEMEVTELVRPVTAVAPAYSVSIFQIKLS